MLSWKMALLLTSYWLHNWSWQLLSAPGQEYKSYGNLGCAPCKKALKLTPESINPKSTKKNYSDKKKQSFTYLGCYQQLHLAWLLIFLPYPIVLLPPLPQIQTSAGCCRSVVWCYAGTVSWLQTASRMIPRLALRSSSFHRHCLTQIPATASPGLRKKEFHD